MLKAEKVQELLKVFKPYPLKEQEFEEFYVDTSEARGYDSTYSIVDPYELLSMVKTNNRDGSIHEDGRAIIKEIIEKRAKADLFGEGVADYIIEKSGGVLRDVFEMIENATRRARRKNREAQQISIEDAKEAYLMLKSGYERGISERHIIPLKRLYSDPVKKPLDDDESVLMELLRSLSVIEYNCERWCGLHPAIVDFLKEKGEI